MRGLGADADLNRGIKSLNLTPWSAELVRERLCIFPNFPHFECSSSCLWYYPDGLKWEPHEAGSAGKQNQWRGRGEYCGVSLGSGLAESHLSSTWHWLYASHHTLGKFYSGQTIAIIYLGRFSNPSSAVSRTDMPIYHCWSEIQCQVKYKYITFSGFFQCLAMMETDRVHYLLDSFKVSSIMVQSCSRNRHSKIISQD